MSPSSGNVKKTYGLIFLMTALLLWAGAGSAWAFDVCVNGTPVELSVRPALRGVKVMLPLKCLAQPLGLEVAYEALGGPVVVSGGDQEAVVVADTCEVKADGKTFDLGVAPYWDKEEIMVPMQFFIDAFGFSANFDPLSATMWIQSGGYKPIPCTAEVLGGRQEEAPEEEAAAGMSQSPACPMGSWWRKLRGSRCPRGLQILAISQFLQEIREQTAVLAGTEVPGEESEPG